MVRSFNNLDGAKIMATRMEFSFDTFSREMRWTFGFGIPDVTFTVPKVDSDDPTIEPALCNGYKQKIADAAALARDTKTGQSATFAEKRAAMQEVVDRLARGEWNALVGGKPRLVDVDALVAVIAALRQKPVVGVRAYVESRTEEQRKALAASKEFAEAYAREIARKRPARELDPDLEAGLDAIED
jgi:hypothetical protein